MTPNVTISHGRKGKGIKGIELINKPFDLITITKRVLLSVLSQLYDPLGVFLDPHKIGLKIIYSRVCLTSVCADLAQKASDACNELVSLKQINPKKRESLSKGYRVK